jgi:hypothetical protein
MLSDFLGGDFFDSFEVLVAFVDGIFFVVEHAHVVQEFFVLLGLVSPLLVTVVFVFFFVVLTIVFVSVFVVRVTEDGVHELFVFGHLVESLGYFFEE